MRDWPVAQKCVLHIAGFSNPTAIDFISIDNVWK